MGGRSIRRLGNGFVLYGLISAVFTINAFAVHTQLFRFKFPAKFMKIDPMVLSNDSLFGTDC